MDRLNLQAENGCFYLIDDTHYSSDMVFSWIDAEESRRHPVAALHVVDAPVSASRYGLGAGSGVVPLGCGLSDDGLTVDGCSQEAFSESGAFENKRTLMVFLSGSANS